MYTARELELAQFSFILCPFINNGCLCVVKDLNDFILVEPEEHNSSVNGASMLRRSADFSKMLLEYDFAAFGTGGSVRYEFLWR